MGMLSIRILSDSEIKRIHKISLKLLKEVGVDICHERIRSELLNTGAKVIRLFRKNKGDVIYG